MTRQQQYLQKALDHLQQMQSQSAETRAVYASLCQRIPVLLRVNGLCQTLAFVQDKAAGEGPRALAYQALLEHMRSALQVELGCGLAQHELAQAIAALSTTEYVRCTRTLLAVFVYYKRFAGSALADTQ